MGLLAGLISSGGGARARALAGSLRQRAAGGGGGGKGGKGAPAKGKKAKAEIPIGPTVDKEIRAKVVLGANILKEGTDPTIKPDSEYPPWLFHLLNKPPALSELERKDPAAMTLAELQRFVKLDNRRKIKESNLLKAKS